MKTSTLLLAALLCVSTPAVAATGQPVNGEERNSMFETDVEKMQLGHNDGQPLPTDAPGQNAPGQNAPGQNAPGQSAPSAPQGRGWQPLEFPGQNPQGRQGQIQAAQPPSYTQSEAGAPATLPNIPLGNLDESNAGLELGTSLPKGSTWQLNSFSSAQGQHPHQIYKLSPSAALTVYFDPARRRAVKINIEVVHVPSVYGPQAKSTFENEVLMAVLFGGNLFAEMERNHALAKAMEDTLSLRNTSIVQGNIVDFGLTSAPIVYSARLEGGRYTLSMTAKNH